MQDKPDTVLLQQFRQIRAEMNLKFERIETRLPALTRRLDKIEQKLGVA